MFFVDSRAQFFKPLTTKYRAQVAECLCLMHQRLYGAAAEYGQALNRDQVLDIFEEALARSPVLEGRTANFPHTPSQYTQYIKCFGGVFKSRRNTRFIRCLGFFRTHY
jgi:hypothetical protein